MFSYDELMKAVQLLLQYDMSYASVIRELGYPSRRGLCDWYEEYIKNGDLHRDFIKKSTFTEEERQKAIDYYLEHEKCISRTVRSLGYPSLTMLDKWINDTAPELKKHCRSGGSLVKYSKEEKEQDVIDLCSRNGSAKEIALEHGVTRETLYNWKGQLLSNRSCQSMSKQKKEILTSQPNNAETISDIVCQFSN